MSFALDRVFLLLAALLPAACGASTKPPAEPASVENSSPAALDRVPSADGGAGPEPVAPAEGKAEAGAAAESLETTAETASPPAETPPPPPPAARRPIEILTAANVAFIVDFQNSEPHLAAEQSCEAESGEDRAVRNECMKKARAAFKADVLHFRKDAQGRFSLTVYERKGSALPELYTARIEFSDESERSVNVRLREEKGKRPFFAGSRQIAVSVPNEYTVELNEPKLGRLVYGAKVGLVGDR